MVWKAARDAVAMLPATRMATGEAEGSLDVAVRSREAVLGMVEGGCVRTGRRIGRTPRARWKTKPPPWKHTTTGRRQVDVAAVVIVGDGGEVAGMAVGGGGIGGERTPGAFDVGRPAIVLSLWGGRRRRRGVHLVAPRKDREGPNPRRRRRCREGGREERYGGAVRPCKRRGEDDLSS